jgi:hypothetical protein
MSGVAACCTGQLRYFPHTRRVIHLGLSKILHDAHIVGIRPVNEDWTTFRQTFPSSELHVQQTCSVKQDALRRLMCQSKHRGNCRLNFVQELCDAQLCLLRIEKKEAAQMKQFETLVRFRPDMLWEMQLSPAVFSDALGVPLEHSGAAIRTAPNQVHVPFMMKGFSSRTTNDQFALGGRRGMHVYLNRLEAATSILESRKLTTSEQLLTLVLRKHNVRITEHPEWIYCLLTNRTLHDSSHKNSSCVRRWMLQSRTCDTFLCNYECACNSNHFNQSGDGISKGFVGVYPPLSSQLFMRRDLYDLTSLVSLF